MVHAEANGIFNAARMGASLKGCTLYCTKIPCATCAQGIIQAGITTVVVECLEPPADDPFVQRWKADFEITKTMFTEAGVCLREMTRGEE
jgi:dCMP deaminase